MEACSFLHLTVVFGRNYLQIVAVSLLLALEAVHGSCLSHEHSQVFSPFKQFLKPGDLDIGHAFG